MNIIVNNVKCEKIWNSQFYCFLRPFFWIHLDWSNIVWPFHNRIIPCIKCGFWSSFESAFLRINFAIFQNRTAHSFRMNKTWINLFLASDCYKRWAFSIKICHNALLLVCEILRWLHMQIKQSIQTIFLWVQEKKTTARAKSEHKQFDNGAW